MYLEGIEGGFLVIQPEYELNSWNIECLRRKNNTDKSYIELLSLKVEENPISPYNSNTIFSYNRLKVVKTLDEETDVDDFYFIGNSLHEVQDCSKPPPPISCALPQFMMNCI